MPKIGVPAPRYSTSLLGRNTLRSSGPSITSRRSASDISCNDCEYGTVSISRTSPSGNARSVACSRIRRGICPTSSTRTPSSSAGSSSRIGAQGAKQRHRGSMAVEVAEIAQHWPARVRRRRRIERRIEAVRQNARLLPPLRRVLAHHKIKRFRRREDQPVRRRDDAVLKPPIDHVRQDIVAMKRIVQPRIAEMRHPGHAEFRFQPQAEKMIRHRHAERYYAPAAEIRVSAVPLRSPARPAAPSYEIHPGCARRTAETAAPAWPPVPRAAARMERRDRMRTGDRNPRSYPIPRSVACRCRGPRRCRAADATATGQSGRPADRAPEAENRRPPERAWDDRTS